MTRTFRISRLLIAIFAIIPFFLGRAYAVNTGSSAAGFKVEMGSPPSSANPALVYDNVTVTFKGNLWYDDASHHEQPAADVNYQKYSITVGNDGFITNVNVPLTSGWTLHTDDDYHGAQITKTGSDPSGFDSGFTTTFTCNWTGSGARTVTVTGSAVFTVNPTNTLSSTASYSQGTYVKNWTPGTGIVQTTGGGAPAITNPATTDPIDGPTTVTVSPCTDLDSYTLVGYSGPGSSGTDPDTLNYTWSVSAGGGSISGTGPSATWTPPDSPSGNYTVTCVIDDLPKAPGQYETGSRGDSSVTVTRTFTGVKDRKLKITGTDFGATYYRKVDGGVVSKEPNVANKFGNLKDDTLKPGLLGYTVTVSGGYSGVWGSNSSYVWDQTIGSGWTSDNTGTFNSASIGGCIEEFHGSDAPVAILKGYDSTAPNDLVATANWSLVMHDAMEVVVADSWVLSPSSNPTKTELADTSIWTPDSTTPYHSPNPGYLTYTYDHTASIGNKIDISSNNSVALDAGDIAKLESEFNVTNSHEETSSDTQHFELQLASDQHIAWYIAPVYEVHTGQKAIYDATGYSHDVFYKVKVPHLSMGGSGYAIDIFPDIENTLP